MVLVVDDIEELRVVMVKLLRIDGYEVRAVDSGKAALEFIKTRRPHCVILDISMPGMDGFEVLTRIRANPDQRGVRIIMYSAYDGDHEKTALRLGADAYVQKGSLDWAKMRGVLKRYCIGGSAGGRPKMLDDRREGNDVI